MTFRSQLPLPCPRQPLLIDCSTLDGMCRAMDPALPNAALRHSGPVNLSLSSHEDETFLPSMWTLFLPHVIFSPSSTCAAVFFFFKP